MNAVSKVSLRLLLSGNKPRSRNKQRDFIWLIERRHKNWSDKAFLNILRAVNARWGGAGPRTGKGNKTAKDPRFGAGIRQNNKALKVLKPAERDNGEVGDFNKRVRDLRQKDEKAAELAARARTEVRRLSSCAFFLVVWLFYFLTFSSLESVIGCPLSTGSIVRSGALVTSTNCKASSSR